MSTTFPPESWPESLHDEMDARFRASAYGGINDMCAWLTQIGHDTPRIAVYHYALQLRSIDAAAGNIPALMLEHTRAGRMQRLRSGLDLARPSAEIVEDLLAWGARRVDLFGAWTPPHSSSEGV